MKMKINDLNEQQRELAYLFGIGFCDFFYDPEIKAWIADQSYGRDDADVCRLHRIVLVSDVGCTTHRSEYSVSYSDHDLMQQCRNAGIMISWENHPHDEPSFVLRLQEFPDLMASGKTFKEAFQKIIILREFDDDICEGIQKSCNFDKSKTLKFSSFARG